MSVVTDILRLLLSQSERNFVFFAEYARLEGSYQSAFLIGYIYLIITCAASGIAFACFGIECVSGAAGAQESDIGRVQDYEYDDALRAFDLSMKKLGLDYLDLYLMHKPYGNYYAAWRAMERLYKEGRIRAIGVTSFSNERLQDLFLHNEIKPVVNQLETHPFFQQQAANAFLQQEGIQHEAWAPFAEGQNDIFNHPTLKAIAEQHDKGVRAIILRWLNQRNIVVIPKSVHKERMIENFNILDFTLSKEEMDAIALLETGKSPIYDDMDLLTVKGIGLHKIHE